MPKKKLLQKSNKPGIREQLLQACRELNPQADEGLLKSCAEFLHISSFSGGLKDQPNLQTKGGKRAKEQLLGLMQGLTQVRKNLHKMNGEARTALKNVHANETEGKRQANIGKAFPSLRRKAPDLTMMEFYIEEYILQACQAHDMLAESPATKGANKKNQPEEVTKVVAHVYKTVTGREPKITGIDDPSTHAQGPFLDFLTKIFKILGITASAENQARNFLYPTRKK